MSTEIKKWEYAIFLFDRDPLKSERRLNELGIKGWRVIHADSNMINALLEREIPDSASDNPATDDDKIEQLSTELSLLLEKRADALPEGRDQNIARGGAIETALQAGDEDRANDLSAKWGIK